MKEKIKTIKDDIKNFILDNNQMFAVYKKINKKLVFGKMEKK